MIRTILFFTWLTLSLIISIPFSFRVNYLTKKNRTDERDALVHKCTNLWAKSILKVCGVKVNVHGLENLPKDKNVLFIGNHQGNFDIPIYLASMPRLIGFVAKIETEKMPLISTWMKHMYCVFMDRSSVRKSGEAIIYGIKNLKAGKNMVIFPEGTRSRGNQMGEFKSGSFRLATKSNCPIVPITMDGSYKAMEASKHSFIKSTQVNLYIHPVVETSTLTKEEIIALPETIYNIIDSKISK